MKKRVHQNSKLAYASCSFQDQELKVIRALEKLGASTRKQLSTYLKLPINCVTGRVTALLDRGILEVSGHIIDTDTNRQNGVLRIKRKGRGAA